MDALRRLLPECPRDPASDTPPVPGRRRFLGDALAGIAASAAPVAFARDRLQPGPQPGLPAAALANSLAHVPGAFGPTPMTIQGRWPAGLQGVLYRNGPARFVRGDTRYRHWFDGDGMVHAFAMGPGGISHRGRMVATTRAGLEQAAGRFLWDGFGTHFADARPTRSPDTLNVANISVLPIGDEVMALWEAGSAWRLDGRSLQTLGRKTWSPDTDGAPFGAHPRIEPDGRIWNIGYLPGSGKLLVYDISATGRLHRSAMLDMPHADMVHDFAMSAHHLVLVLSPLVFERGEGAFGDLLRWQPQRGNRIVLIDKDTLTIRAQYEGEAAFFFHLGNAWEDGDSVRVQVMNQAPYPALHAAIGQATRGLPITPLVPVPASERVIDRRRGTVRDTVLPTGGNEFPSFDGRHAGRPARRLVVLGRSADAPADAFGFDTVQVLDRQTDSVARFAYPRGVLAEEHLFVARPGGRDSDGWIVGTHYDSRAHRSGLSVFDAGHVEDGPLAQVTMPYALPMGLHGRFVAAHG
ncbi:MAG: carotenoid oxygenase family protein [Burkholderiaceae bacterium]